MRGAKRRKETHTSGLHLCACRHKYSSRRENTVGPSRNVKRPSPFSDGTLASSRSSDTLMRFQASDAKRKISSPRLRVSGNGVTFHRSTLPSFMPALEIKTERSHG